MLLPLSYVGRTTHRVDGEARRIAILEATLRLIVKEGIRGVRHRAVASEADVPLASTTYYFKDIKDLINDALTYFAEKTLWMNNALEEKSFQLLQALADSEQPIASQAFTANLAQFLCDHVEEQVSHRDDRVLEFAFHEEALRNPELAKAIRALDDGFIATIENFFIQLGRDSAMSDAHQLLAVIRWVEYQSVVKGEFNRAKVDGIIGATIQNILK